MRLRTELALAGGVAAALLVLAYGTGRRARGADDPDRRASSFGAGREGTRAVADAAERLGIEVTRWRQRPQAVRAWLEGRGRDGAGDAERVGAPRGTGGTSESPRAARFALLEPARSVSPAERREIIALTTRAVGADLVLAGSQSESLVRCFGYLILTRLLDSARVAAPGAIADRNAAFVHGRLVSASDSTMRRNRPEVARDKRESAEGACPDVRVTRTDTVLITPAGGAALLRLTVAPHGRTVMLVADASLLRNRTLRHSSTAPLVLDAVLPRAGQLIFDEYHQGFGERGSMARMALAWSARHPLGWMVWQLFVVGLMALATGAVRFGPVRAAIARTRRSPLEHVRALATALAAARGHGVAVGAIVRGLRRRLALSSDHPHTRDDWYAWLAQLSRNAPTARAREAAARLQRLADRPDSDTAVLSAAHAVEDLWHALRP